MTFQSRFRKKYNKWTWSNKSLFLEINKALLILKRKRNIDIINGRYTYVLSLFKY